MILTGSCASTSPKETQSRLPKTKQQVPDYETDEDLKRKIVKLEKDLAKNNSDTGVLMQLASLHQEINEQDKALVYMERLKDMDFRDDPRLYGSLASIYKKRENYAQAIESYKTFKSLAPPGSSVIPKIDKEIEQLNFVITSLAEQSNINLRRFGDVINTENSEYLPQFTLDDKTFIFTRRFFNQEDLFIATKTEVGYETEAIEEVNTLLNEGAHTLSADGSLLIFTHCNKKTGFGGCDLYRSTRKADGTWSKPANMGKNINTRHWDAQPSLSADGRTLYFASSRPGGQGGTDIWASRLSKEGRWSRPVNLGTNINTTAPDESPFIHADGQTLYYRSRGQLGMGGFDLYRSKLENNAWSQPMHLGSPINTTGEDGALVVSLDGTRGYYATDNYKGVKQNHLDLFEFDLPMAYRPAPMTFVKGRITDETTKMPIRGSIQVSYLDDSNYSTTYNANANGEFLAALPIGKPTLLNINKEGYVFFSDHVNYKDVKYSIDPYVLNIELSTIEEITAAPEESKPIILKNIFFNSGSAELLSSSTAEVDILYQLLQDKPAVTIEISGHTDDVGADGDNLRLSQSRAEAVRDALINKGISSSRITAVGRGETEPIDTNDTEEGRANNRRTEFIIKS